MIPRWTRPLRRVGLSRHRLPGSYERSGYSAAPHAGARCTAAENRTAPHGSVAAAARLDDIGFHLVDSSLSLATPAAPPRARTEVAIAPALLEGYVGEYQLAPGFVIEVTREGNQLFIRATGQSKLPFSPNRKPTSSSRSSTPGSRERLRRPASIGWGRPAGPLVLQCQLG